MGGREYTGKYIFYYKCSLYFRYLVHKENKLPVYIQFTVVRQVIIYNQRNLLNVNSASPNIGCNQNSPAYILIINKKNV